MGKGRAPCCDKSQVKRGPWSPSEDLRLIAFIQKHGHENWRALPKQAGLLRCGKSCRLRWINYLRPDVKRGNFTKEDEDTIIKLHDALGNKWSKIASYLPGRTDNEIKNMWNTHLKKRLAHNKSDVATDHRLPDESPKQSSSSATSSCSSSSIRSVSCGRSNFKAADEIEHCHQEGNSAMKVIGMPVDQLSSYSVSFDNCNSSSNASNLVNGQQNDGTNELDRGTHSKASVGMQEISKSPSLLDIPLESDAEFWNMLDGLDPFVTSNDQMMNLQLQGTSRAGEDEDGYNKWFQYLENELGLEGHHQNYQDYPLVGEVVDQTMGYFRPVS